MATFSKNGKRMGRPPNAETAAPAATAQEVAVGRAMLKMMNRYDGAGRGRRMAAWNAPSTGPNQAINAGLQTLRNRSSDAARNDWTGETVIQKWATTLIGIAITPRFRRIENKGRRTEINDLWGDFVKKADADCVLDLYGMQTLAVRSWIERGEMFARRRFRSSGDDLPVPVQVQLLESDMVPNFDADTFQGLPLRNKIRSGIEFDARGRRVAYWVYKDHPGDQPTGSGSIPAASALVRVVAEDMLHLFEPKRIGQRRGVPTMAPILAKLRGVADFEDTTLERQKLANLIVGFISRDLPTLDATDPNVAAALSGLDAELDENASPLLPMKPGLMQELEDGQKVTWSNPPDAGVTYSDYMRTSHLGTTAGTGLPYEIAVGDIKGVSDRTLRVVINEFRRFASQRQWQIVIPQFCQRIIEWFADAASLAGEITLTERDQVVRAEHAPHGWEYIHPTQDVQGKVLEVKNGFRSRSSVIGEQGDDPDVVDQERAEDAQRERDLDLPVTGLPDGVAQDEDEIDNDEYDAPPNPSGPGVRAELTRLARIEAQTDALRAAARSTAARDDQAARDAELHASIVALLTESTPSV